MLSHFDFVCSANSNGYIHPECLCRIFRPFIPSLIYFHLELRIELNQGLLVWLYQATWLDLENKYGVFVEAIPYFGVSKFL